MERMWMLQLNRGGLRLYVTSREKIGDCIAITGQLRQWGPEHASLDCIAFGSMSWTVLLMYGRSPRTRDQIGNPVGIGGRQPWTARSLEGVGV